MTFGKLRVLCYNLFRTLVFRHIQELIKKTGLSLSFAYPELVEGYIKQTRGKTMNTRIAVMSIIVEDTGSAAPLNDILHEYCEYIIGRMGLPYRQRNVNIISVALDAPQTIISAVSGKIGNLPGVEVKTTYSNK